MNLSMRSCLMFGLAAVITSSALAQTSGVDPYKQLLNRDYGTAIEALQAIDKEVQDANGAQVAVVEAKLIAVIESSEATMPAKQYACQAIKAVRLPAHRR